MHINMYIYIRVCVCLCVYAELYIHMQKYTCVFTHLFRYSLICVTLCMHILNSFYKSIFMLVHSCMCNLWTKGGGFKIWSHGHWTHMLWFIVHWLWGPSLGCCVAEDKTHAGWHRAGDAWSMNPNGVDMFGLGGLILGTNYSGRIWATQSCHCRRSWPIWQLLWRTRVQSCSDTAPAWSNSSFFKTVKFTGHLAEPTHQ